MLRRTVVALFKGIKDNRPSIFNPDNAWKLARSVQDKIAELPPTSGTAVQAARFLQSRPACKRRTSARLTSRRSPRRTRAS